MSFSTQQVSRNHRRHAGSARCLAAILIAAMIVQIGQANEIGRHARVAIRAGMDNLDRKIHSWSRKNQDVSPQSGKDVSQLVSEVKRIRLCPRRLLLYTGEQFTFVPLPLDRNNEVVHGVTFAWESSDDTVAEVVSDGSVKALRAGRSFLTASLGNRKDRVAIEVRDTRRPLLTNSQWDSEHVAECDDPEQSASTVGEPDGVTLKSVGSGSNHGGFAPALIVDPDDTANVANGGGPANAVGDPRFTPAETIQGITAKAKNQLGSSNFSLTIPIFEAAGRGIGTSVALVYNSRTWTRDGTRMVFDYDQGWPAPGFRLNYGRIIPNYDKPNGGSGNYLLIEADGTRTPLIKQTGGTIYRSDDGRFIDFDATSNGLSYPDGTVVFYSFNGSKLLPNSIKDINGNSISITPVISCSDAQRIEPCSCGSGCARPQRQAINQISDTLGRLATFYYRADGNLAEVRVAGYNGGADRVVARFSYQALNLSYNFGTMTVSNVPPGNQVDVLRKVYFPDTGRGYVFEPYSGYGMCTKVSMRLGMTDISDGTEVAFTEYLYQTAGALADSPQFTERHEWWQGKTDDLGNLQDSSHPAVFTYGRTSDSAVTWVTAPNGARTETVSNTDPTSSQVGLVNTQRIIRASDGAVLSQSDYVYSDRTSAAGLQMTTSTTSDDAGNQTKTTSTFGAHGRLMEFVEYGLPIGGVFKPRRRTVYTYVDDPNYINLSLRRLVNDISVFDGKGSTTVLDDLAIARTAYIYDTPDPGWELETYGYTQNCSPPACLPPPGFATNKINRVQRGNITKVQTWSDATAATAQINSRRRYDIFGNELKAEVSCCSVKRFTFSADTAGMHYSVPLSVTDGSTGGPGLTTSYQYDFNTGFLNSETDANNLVTRFAPDAAMRVRSVIHSSGAVAETVFADPNYTRDGLVSQNRVTYLDGATQRVQVINQWLDGAGRSVRSGRSTGANPTVFEAAKSIYDEMGRLRKTTNPYTGDVNGDTPGLPFATSYAYDEFDRIKSVTLPDGNTITTDYNGLRVTVTDQAGRQRRSEVDGFGRTIKITEMDSSKQLTVETSYGYDMNDNLTSVDQGGQTRAFRYDSLSRLIFERTPEQDSTINDGTGTFWSGKYTYTDFNAVLTHQDSRGVLSTRGYDGLNRLINVTYGTSGTSAQPTATVSLSYGSVAPKLGLVEEVRQTDAQNMVPWKESYGYDAQSRVTSKTISFDNQVYSYTSSYAYNQAGQVTQITYPSQRVVRYGFDALGRMNTVGDGISATKYISAIGYTPSQQISSISMNNGVTESYGYSSDRLQLTSQTAAKSGNTLMSLGYNYVADKSRSGGVGAGQANTGQLMDVSATIKDPNNVALQRNESYNYDQIGRLSQAGGFYAQRNYTYDRWGNRTAVSGGSSQNVALQTQPGAPAGVPNNRISSVNGGAGYQYDAAGNTTYDSAHSYTYDGENRVVKVDAGATATYFYDSANRRIKKVAAGATTYFVWEGMNVIAEYSDAPGGVGGTRFYHPDRLSNRMLTDANGSAKGAMSNLPFGEEGGVAGESEKHRFTNYERDSETGSDYAINRQHSTFTGRFMRPDPISVSEPQSLNRYSYVANDPANATDPLGLFMDSGCQTFVSGTLYTYNNKAIFFAVSSVKIVCPTSGLLTVASDRSRGGQERNTRRVGSQRSADQCLRDCYKLALYAYNEAGTTRAQEIVDWIESSSPLRGFLSMARGIDEAAKVLKGGPGFITRNGLQGPMVKGSIGSAAKSGLGKMFGGAGALAMGIGLGGLLTQVLEPFIGRDKFIRDAVDYCNSGCSGASRKISSSIFGTASRLRDFLHN